MKCYREARLEGSFDPIAVVSSLTGSGLLTQHVVYERDKCWYVGANPLSEVIVDPRYVRSTVDGNDITEPWSGTPWRQVQAALRRAPLADWTAYGWAAFELASQPGGASSEPLAHLIVPGVELRITEHHITIRSVDQAMLDSVQTVVQAAAPLHVRSSSMVDIHVGRESYLSNVAYAVEQIQQGHLQKVIISRCVPVPFKVDMCATYVLGRSGNTPARSFLLDLGGWQAAGFSPETVVEVHPGGVVSTQPLAGTRALTGDKETDAALRAALLTDPKEIFEHAASVKLAFEELETIGSPASTQVSEFLAIKPRGSVQHLASRVNTTLDESHDTWDAMGAVFPSITASGIPKAPAYKLITGLESEPRGLYSGAVLRTTSDGLLDAALVLRSIYQRDGRTWLRAGAGVVASSRPEREYEETCEKLRSVSRYVVADDESLSYRGREPEETNEKLGCVHRDLAVWDEQRETGAVIPAQQSTTPTKAPTRTTADATGEV